MKKHTILSLLLLLILPITLNAQWKRETGFTVGITNPVFNNDDNYYERVGIMMKLGVSQSWNNPLPRISFRPEVGLNIEILPVDISWGGHAINGSYVGTIAGINGELAALGQIRLTKRLIFALGPAGKYLLTDITKMTHLSSCWIPCTQFNSGTIEYNGFNRKYLNKPSIGIKALLLQQNISEKVSLGIVFDHQWKNAPEDYFYFSQTTEVSFYLGLH